MSNKHRLAPARRSVVISQQLLAYHWYAAMCQPDSQRLRAWLYGHDEPRMRVGILSLTLPGCFRVR